MTARSPAHVLYLAAGESFIRFHFALDRIERSYLHRQWWSRCIQDSERKAKTSHGLVWVRATKLGDSRECRLRREKSERTYFKRSMAAIARERPVTRFGENADFLIVKVEADQGVGPRTRASAPPSNPIHITLPSA
jgi:hypothetical protein